MQISNSQSTLLPQPTMFYYFFKTFFSVSEMKVGYKSSKNKTETRYINVKFKTRLEEPPHAVVMILSRIHALDMPSHSAWKQVCTILNKTDTCHRYLHRFSWYHNQKDH